MAGTILLVLTKGFNDMAFLSNQVLLEEANHDVIICSKTNDAIKGQESSVMTVSLSEALNQNVNYSAMVVIGGKDLENWSFLGEVINKFHREKKLIGAIGNDSIQALKNAGLSYQFSSDDVVVISENVITLFDSEDFEQFVDKLTQLI